MTDRPAHPSTELPTERPTPTARFTVRADALPAWAEAKRAEIEAALPPLELPEGAATAGGHDEPARTRDPEATR